ncbi:MAG: hypothetical protein JZU58_21975 [Curvibacter lanceolatus]|jgi:hypothetical protein|nr:hypothetical protein [Curvibacter lanceolatus]
MSLPTPSATSADLPDGLLIDLKRLIDGARQRTVAAVNSELTLLYWSIGQRIHNQILQGRRADYGQEVLVTVSHHLEQEYGRGFAEKNLRRMVLFARLFPAAEIVATLSRQLTWSHFLALLPLKDPLQREFYAQMASTERWSVRTLRGRIDSMLYERTALSQQPANLIEQELTSLRQEQTLSPALLMTPARPGPAAALGWAAAWAMA